MLMTRCMVSPSGAAGPCTGPRLSSAIRQAGHPSTVASGAVEPCVDAVEPYLG